MARGKIKLAWIENNSARKNTLKKRRGSLLEKMEEFTILCNVNGFIIMYAPDSNEPAVWPDRPMVEEIISRFQNIPETQRCKKMMNTETYLKEMVAKMEGKIMKHQKKNYEMELSERMHQIEKGKPFDSFEVNELTTLVLFLAERMKEMKKRVDFLEQGSLPNPHEGFLHNYAGSDHLGQLKQIDLNNNVGPSSSIRTDMELQPPCSHFGSSFNAYNDMGLARYGNMEDNIFHMGNDLERNMMPYNGNTGGAVGGKSAGPVMKMD